MLRAPIRLRASTLAQKHRCSVRPAPASSSVRLGVHLRFPRRPAGGLATSSEARPSQPRRRRTGHDCDRGRPRLDLQARSFGTGASNEGSEPSDVASKPSPGDDRPVLLYEGPFASLTLKLKRVSLTSAAIGIFGLPALTLLYGAEGSVPPTGQVAVIATAGFAAVGSTVLLGYCFSPYVHALERLPGSKDGGGGSDGTEGGATGGGELMKITTHDILSRRIETVFDPATEVSPPTAAGNSRLFCNFLVRGQPMYVHPELIRDHELRVKLVGEEPRKEGADEMNKKKIDDDEFF